MGEYHEILYHSLQFNLDFVHVQVILSYLIVMGWLMHEVLPFTANNKLPNMRTVSISIVEQLILKDLLSTEWLWSVSVKCDL